MMKKSERQKYMEINSPDLSKNSVKDRETSLRRKYIAMRNEKNIPIVSATQNKYLNEGILRNFAKNYYALQIKK
jgi:hypothetical protein